MTPRRGDIWIADLNPRFGTEPGKLRPVLIVQTDLLNDAEHPSTIICLMTSRLRPDVEFLRLALATGVAGLTKPSELMLDQLRAIDNQRFRKRLGHLPPKLLKIVEERLRVVLEL